MARGDVLHVFKEAPPAAATRPDPAAHTVYRASDGDRVPSVTQVLGLLGARQLVAWANRQGLSGIDTERDTTARNVGTLTHAGIEWVLAGSDPAARPDTTDYEPEIVEQARWALANWRAWHAEHEVTPVEAELPLIHEELRYGGTFDLVAEVDGALELLDWKSTGRKPKPYARHFVQLAAYRELLRANGHAVPDRLRVVSFSRQQDAPIPYVDQVVRVDDIPAYWRVFLAALETYEACAAVGW